MNIMLLNPAKNYDKVVREFKKDDPQERIVTKELKKAYSKEIVNGIAEGIIVGFAIVGVVTCIQYVQDRKNEE